MSARTDFVDGIIATLVAAGAGVHRIGAKYTTDDVGIALNVMPDDPDKMIVITPYSPGGGDLLLTVDRLAFQVRTRGDLNPRTEMAIADSCYEALHGLRQVQFGSVHIIAMTAMSNVPPTRDTNNRWYSMTHFYADVDLPATSNRS